MSSNRFFSNFFAVSSMNVLSLIISFILVPLLISKLGVEGYGKFALAFFIAQFQLVIIEFGFDLKTISNINKKIFIDLSRRIRLEFNIVIISRAIIFFVTLMLLACVFFLYFILTEEFDCELSTILVFLLISNIPAIFSPGWYYQYKQEMWKFSLISVVNRLISLLCIIILVNINLFSLGVVFALSSLVTLIFYLNLSRLAFGRSNINVTFKMAKLSLFYIYKCFSISIYRINSAAVTPIFVSLISIFLDYKYVAIFDIFNKISGVVNMFTNAACQALYPILIGYNFNFKKILRTFSIYISIVVICCVCAYALIYFGSNYILKLCAFLFDDLAIDVFSFLPLIIVFTIFVAFNSFFSRVYVIFDLAKLVTVSTIMSSAILFFTILTFNWLGSLQDFYLIPWISYQLSTTLLFIFFLWRNKCLFLRV